MKYFSLIILSLSLTACEDFSKMSRGEIISAIKECESAGMNPLIFRFFGDGEIINIQCIPKNEVTK